MFERGSTWGNLQFRTSLAESGAKRGREIKVTINPGAILDSGLELNLLHLLTPVQRKILVERRSLSENDLARKFGVSKQRISAAEKSALARLKKYINIKQELNEARQKGLDEILSPAQLAVMQLVFYEGKTPLETAEILGHSLGHARTLLREGQRKARVIISQNFASV